MLDSSKLRDAYSQVPRPCPKPGTRLLDWLVWDHSCLTNMKLSNRRERGQMGSLASSALWEAGLPEQRERNALPERTVRQMRPWGPGWLLWGPVLTFTLALRSLHGDTEATRGAAAGRRVAAVGEVRQAGRV